MVTLVVGNLWSAVQGISLKNLNDLRDIFKIENPYMQRKASNFMIPQFKYMITEKGMFLTGLVDMVHAQLTKTLNIEVKVVDNRTVVELPDDKYIERVLDEIPYSLREYQEEALLTVLSNSMGIIQAATGAGKSIVMATALKIRDCNAIVVVGKKDLFYQLHSEIKDYTGWTDSDVGLIGDGIFRPAKVTVCIINSLVSGKKPRSPKVKKFLDTVEAVYVDEAHNAGAPSYRYMINACPNASLRYGFSATPTTAAYRVESGQKIKSDIYLTALFGPVIFSIKTKHLVEEGFLAEPTIKFIKNELYNDSQYLEYNFEYERIIMKDNDRNKIICDIIDHHLKRDEKIIGFVTRIDHGDTIRDMLVKEYGVDPKQVAFVNGGESVKGDRRKYIQGFKDLDSEIRVLLGTVLNEGLNFQVHVGINIAGGAADRAAVQRLGRILRKSKDPLTGDVNTSIKECVTYYDFTDSGHKFFKQHSKDRKFFYEREGLRVYTLEKEEMFL